MIGLIEGYDYVMSYGSSVEGPCFLVCRLKRMAIETRIDTLAQDLRREDVVI